MSLTARRRPIRTVAPLHYQSNYRYPLLVWLHGAGGDERQIEDVLPHISLRNYFGLGIRGVQALDVGGRRFDWPDNRSATTKAADAILQAIDSVTDDYSIHPDRVILAGYGSGGTLACRVAMKHCDRFAAVVRMSGFFPVGSGAFENSVRLRQRKLPMLWQQAANGVDDDPKRLVKEIAAAQWIRSKVEIRQYVDDDVMNTVALRDIDQWCFDNVIAPKPADHESEVSLPDGDQLSAVDFSAN